MSEEAQKDADLAIIKAHAEQLMEHFESVQIFVTKKNDDGDGTVDARWGRGNWFARYGQVKAWVVREEQLLRDEADPET